MNREETRKAAEVMMHYANGGEVIRASRNQQDHWTSLRDYDYPDGPLWDWRTAIYRIKPQPVEVIKWAWVINGVVHTCINEQVAKERARVNGGQAVELKGTYTCDT